MPFAKLTVHGQEMDVETSLIRNDRAAIVEISLSAQGDFRGRAHLYPPYHATKGEWLMVMPGDSICTAVLQLFVSGELVVSADDIIENYQAFCESGFPSELNSLAPALPVHPT